MRRFDVTGEAETMLKKLDDEKNVYLKWYEYLEYQFEAIYKEIDDTVLRYQGICQKILWNAYMQLRLAVS